MILIRRYFKSSIFAAFALLLPGAAWSRGLQPVQELVYGCGTSDQIKAGAFAQLARVVTASADREVELRSAQSAIQKEQSIRVAVSSGNWSEEPYQQASRIAEQAVGASSRDLAELFERSSRDQFARSHFYAALKRISWAANLSDGALIYAYYVIGSEGCGVDEDNTRWLKAKIAENGWFTISKYGASADNAAWVLVQHADNDPEFQAATLHVLEPLVARKETSAKNYAYLFDRVAVNAKRLQRYGTQGRCSKSGIWEPHPIEQVEALDERRAAVGLEPQASYNSRFICQTR